MLAADGSVTPVPRGPKEALADAVWDMVAARICAESRPAVLPVSRIGTGTPQALD